MDHPPAPADKTLQGLLGDLRVLIQNARGRVAHAVDCGLVLLYWNIGRRIGKEILGNRRAGYGEHIFQAVAGKLTMEYGQGYSRSNLADMVRFAKIFPDERIVATLGRQLNWTHFRAIIYIDDPLKRDFYAEMCRVERWNTRTLRGKIAGMLFERSALSKKPSELAELELKKLREEDRLTPDLVFRDPYFLDFLGLKGAYHEKDLEAAILRRLVAVELKLERFKPEDKGQMELYLRWLDRHERWAGEGRPVGLILCSGKSEEQIELLELDKSGIRVATYMTELPPRRILEERLREVVAAARARLGPERS